MKTTDARFSSLDRQYSCRTALAAPDRYRELFSMNPAARYICRGAGLSFVPASFGEVGTAVRFSAFDRILDFDLARRLIRVEAGISLDKLHRFLAPHGLCLSVQPGHPGITIGGCIGLNVHGKSSRGENDFEATVEELTLFHPAHGILELSRAERPELFELTCGGLGLTGIILTATLRPRTVPGFTIRRRHVPTRSLEHSVEELERLAGGCDMIYSWNDLGPMAEGAGRGFVVCASFEEAAGTREMKMRAPRRHRHARGPSAYNGLSVALLNMGYRFINTKLVREKTQPFHEFAYPLAGGSALFGLFGRRGFIERCMLIPASRKWEYLPRFEALLRKHRPLVALGAMRLRGGSRRLLRFAGEGISLELDLVPRKRDAAFHRELDELNVAHAVLDSVAKDSRLPRELAVAEYPEYGEFRRRLHDFDPRRVFVSALSERLGL